MRSLLALPMMAVLLACDGNGSGAAIDEGPPQIIRTALTPWPDATEVKLFVEDIPLRDDGFYGMSRPQGVRLSGQQRTALNAAMSKVEYRGRPASGEDTEAACFIPHHFFRWFDASGRQLGEVAVCYCCRDARATPELAVGSRRTSFEADLEKLDDIIVELGFPVDVNC